MGAQKRCDDQVIPVVKSPENMMYILDHHHLLSALDASGLKGVKPTISVDCDFSDAKDMDEFWSRMRSHLLVYNYGRSSKNITALPTEMDPRHLPTVLIFTKGYCSMNDDPWRSFAGLTRKTTSHFCGSTQLHKNNPYPCRGYIKSCNSKGYDIPYYEFRWSYFINAAWLNSSLWDNSSDYEAFADVFKALPPSIPGEVDIKIWNKATKLLFPLFRGKSAGYFVVPSNMGTTAGKLPGSVYGLQPLPEEDPECLVPVCDEKK